jgi:hypothetical protein
MPRRKLKENAENLKENREKHRKNILKHISTAFPILFSSHLFFVEINAEHSTKKMGGRNSQVQFSTCQK